MDKKPISIAECKDCMEAMKSFPDKFFELAIVDPPYNIVSQQRRGIGSRIDASGKMNDWNNAKPPKEYFDELFRVSKNQIVWGANNFAMPESEYFIVWNKMQTVDNFASAEYAWTNVKMPAKVFNYSIHQHNADKGEKIHPTMKPIVLYQWLLKNYAKPGDKILDTHLGSGSSRIAAYKMGFDFWGYEIDRDYFEAQEKRFKQATPLTIFDLMGEPEIKKTETNKLF
jgi:site-specific DNA-methyltransferase (adenine-specific)